MLSNQEISILQIVSQKLLVKKTELLNTVKGPDDTTVIASIERLKSGGLIDILSPMGETSFAITQKGMKFLSSEPQGNQGSPSV